MSINRLFCATFAFILIGGALIFPRSYGDQKLVILILLLFVLAINNFSSKISVGAVRTLLFFSVYALANILAIFIGIIYGNAGQAIFDGFRLGVVFPIIIAFLWISLSDFKYEKFISIVVEMSAIAVSIIIILAVSQFLGFGNFFSSTFLEENLLRVGLHDGYIQVTSHNVGALFFLSGYLLYTTIFNQSFQRSNRSIIALLFVLFAALISGRRALLMAIFFAPLFLFFVAKVFMEPRKVLRRIIKVWLGIIIFTLIFLAYLFLNNYFSLAGFLERYLGIFADDEGARTSQAASLFFGFLNSPLFGSGIGGVTEVVRSETSPWIYELTYLQMLFNFGVFISLLIVFIFLREFSKIYNNSKVLRFNFSLEVKSVFSGVIFLIFGSATNPYLGSFDFLLFIGIIPFIANNILSKQQIKSN